MKNRPLCGVCLIFFLLLCIIIYGGKGKAAEWLYPSSLRECAEEGETLHFTGQVYRKEIRDKYQILFLRDNSIHYQEQSLKESRIMLYDKEKMNIHIGQKIMAEGELSFFDPAFNPGNFDRRAYYERQGIYASVWCEKMEIIAPDISVLSDGLYHFRQNINCVFEKYLSGEDSAALSAMLLGEKAGMDEELKELYQANGIGHVLAISGLHLSFIGIGMYKVLRRTTGSYPIGGIFGILFLMLYILMIGFTVSAVRALVMFLFRVGADMAGRHYDAPTALSVAAVVVLLWRPLSVYDGGFWLSFGAVLAILFVVPVVQEDISVHTLRSNGQKIRMKMKTKTIAQKDMPIHVSCSTSVSYNGLVGVAGSRKGETQNFPRQNRKGEPQSCPRQNRKYGFLSGYLMGVWGYVRQVILQGLTASVGINLVILPILLYYFFEFPLYSFVLNLFVIPLMSVLLFLGMAGSLFALWANPISPALFWVCSKILWIYRMSCELTLCLPGARLVIGRPDIRQIVVYYGILFSGMSLRRYVLLRNKREEQGSLDKFLGNVDRDKRMNRYRRMKCAVVFLWAAGMVILTTRFGETGKLTTVVLDVGQGDGIFMRGPEGNTYLIDGGSSDVKKVGQYRLEPFLKSQGVGRLDYVLISHGDSDHMNGVEELIERQDIGVKIGTLVLPVKEAWDEALAGLAEKAKSHAIHVVVIKPGQSIREGELVITCLQPGNMEIKSEDAESRQEKAVLETGSTGLESGNQASMVLAVQYGEFDMLLTGDVEGEGERQLTKTLEEQYQGCEWEVLKVAHHGSKNSSAEEFLRRIQPAYAFISAGKENWYGHPHQETVKRLRDVGSRVYSTQENGAIIVGVEAGEVLRMEKY